jgi:hypothetical protein
MGCSRFADAVKAHAAGADLTSEARVHLAACEACRAALARHQRFVAGIDADLAHALRVEPSADFLPRVRARAAAQPTAPWWMPGWRMAIGVASLAVVVIVVALAVQPRTSGPRPEPSQVARAVNPTPASPVPVNPRVVPRETTIPDAEQSAGRRAAPVVVRRVAAPRVLTARTREPEVLVPPDQRLAIARLLDMLRKGTLDEKAFPAPAQQVDPEQPVPPIVVEDLAVAPIVIRGGS